MLIGLSGFVFRGLSRSVIRKQETDIKLRQLL